VGGAGDDCRGYGATFVLQPQVIANFHTWPAGYVLPLIAVAGFAAVKFELHRKNERNAFLASCTYFLGMLTSVVFGVYPMVLPARNPAFSLTVAKCQGGGLRLENWPDLVGYRHGAGNRLFCLRLSLVRRQSLRNPRFARPRRLVSKPGQSAPANSTVLSARPTCPRPTARWLQPKLCRVLRPVRMDISSAAH